MNKKEYLRSYFYVVTAILYLIALITDWEIYLSDKAHKHGLTGHRSFGGRMKFLTFINMVHMIDLNTLLFLFRN